MANTLTQLNRNPIRDEKGAIYKEKPKLAGNFKVGVPRQVLLPEIEITNDSVLGIRFAIEMSDLYTKIVIGNRELFFSSETGDFDGSGIRIVQLQ